MIFPSKMFSYEESVLYKFSIVLEELFEPQSIKCLYKNKSKCFRDVSEYIDVLDCLFALNIIDFDDRGDLIRRVD